MAPCITNQIFLSPFPISLQYPCTPPMANAGPPYHWEKRPNMRFNIKHWVCINYWAQMLIFVIIYQPNYGQLLIFIQVGIYILIGLIYIVSQICSAKTIDNLLVKSDNFDHLMGLVLCNVKKLQFNMYWKNKIVVARFSRSYIQLHQIYLIWCSFWFRSCRTKKFLIATAPLSFLMFAG